MQAYSFMVRYDVESTSADAAADALRRYLSEISAREDVQVLFAEGGIVATTLSDEEPEAIRPAGVYGSEDLALVAAT